jgi:hypothetical protein
VVDPQVLADLQSVEEASPLFGAFGLRAEFWEAFTYLKTDRDGFETEMRRLAELRKERRGGALAPEVIEKFKEIRRKFYPLAKQLRTYIESLPGRLDGLRLELAIVFIMGSLQGRETASRWVADPISQRSDAEARLRVMGRLVDLYRKALLEHRLSAPPRDTAVIAASTAPQLPGGAHFADDLRHASGLQELLRGANPPVQVWEALCLVRVERQEMAATVAILERLKSKGKPDEFDAAVLRVQERVALVRQRYGGFVDQLRRFLAGVFGRWEGELEETALAFIAASPAGRHRAKQWLEDPELCRGEATRFVEGLRQRAREALGSLPT